MSAVQLQLKQKMRAATVNLRDVLTQNIFRQRLDLNRFKRTIVVHEGKWRGEYELGIATRPKELIEIFQTRYASHAENGFLNPDFEFDRRMEYDKYDIYAAHLYARNKKTGKLHGCARLVLGDFGKLPMESYCSLETLRNNGKKQPALLELSRLVSLPTRQRELNRQLLRLMFDFMIQQKITYLLASGRCDIKHYYLNMGFQPIEPYQEVSTQGTPICGPMNITPMWMGEKDIKWDFLNVSN